MKAGTENKTKQRIAIVLVIVALLCVTWAVISSSGTSSGPAAVAVTTKLDKTVQKSESLDPRLQLDLLAGSEDVKYEGKGKNIFSSAPEPLIVPEVKISPLIRKQQEEEARRLASIPPPPPPPPPINLKFFGISNSKGEKPRAFLSQGEDVWIAHEGDVVNRHYKILRISPTAVEVEDLLNNNRQSIRLTTEG